MFAPRDRLRDIPGFFLITCYYLIPTEHRSFSPLRRVAMKLVASFLVLLALVALLAIHRKGLTADEAVGKGVRVVVRVTDDAFHNEYRAVTVVVLIAMFAFVMWTVLRAYGRENKAKPPAKESSASNKTVLR